MTDARTEEPTADPSSPPAGPVHADPGAWVDDPDDDPEVIGVRRRSGMRLVRWFRGLSDRPTDELTAMIITLVIVAACVSLVVFVVNPFNVLSDTTPAGGDMGAHVWGPAFLRDHLLDKFRLTGWTMDWYAGFPAYQFYMISPSLLIAVLSWIIPYGVAFKLVAVSGCVSFPVSCWFLGRSARLPFPMPALLSVGGMLFLFDRSFSIYGGNLASTMAGEFAFSLSLSLGIVYLGVLVRGFDTGRHRGWAAALLALTGLCHLLPLIFVGVCTVLYLLVRPGVGRLVYLMTMTPVAVALTAFWTAPFVLRSGYMNDMGWEKITSDRFVNYLWSREKLDTQLLNAPPLSWVIAFAVMGLMLSLVFRHRLGLYLALVAVTFALAFMFVPQGRVWNARMLPFYYLALYLLAAIGVAELIRLAASLFARDLDRPLRGVLWGAPVVATSALLVMLLVSLAALPGMTTAAGGGLTWGIGSLGFTTTDRSFIDSWAAWNFEGYEGLTESASGVESYRKSYPEYHDIVSTMGGLGRDRGCGRAMWEHEEAHDRYGTPMALMLLPFWTDGCIGSMEGLYFEASATTPYHFLQQDELSWTPSNAQRELPYSPGPPTKIDFDRGVRHLQMMGVKYYMAINENTQALADQSTSLSRVAQSGPWKVYEVADAPLVEALANQPAVLTGQPTIGRPWQDTAVCWWVNPSDWDVVLTADGPPGWERVARTNVPDEHDSARQKCQPAADWGWFDGSGGPSTTTQEPVTVSNVVATDDGVSFDVDRPHVPVLVKVSYFPNWKVSGAQGPYRATPNFMVVVPDGNHVELHYGWTVVDLGAIVLTLLGLVGLLLLARAGTLAVAPPSRFWGRAERPDLYPPPERPPPIEVLAADPDRVDASASDDAAARAEEIVFGWRDEPAGMDPAPDDVARTPTASEGAEPVAEGDPGAAADRVDADPGTDDVPPATLRPDADEPADQ
jgi:hypothetical protein